MNQLHVGFNKEVLPVGGCLFIGDDISEAPHKFRPKVSDPAKHSFNPIKDISEAQAQEFAEVIYTVYGQGENTLTVRNGQIDLAPALYKGKRLDELRGSEEVERLRDDILFNPIVRNCLSSKKKDFVFDAGRVIFARLNRTELGTKASLLIGLSLMSFYKGQLVIPDFGFYGRDAHASLIRENRLVAGVNFLGELSDKLRRSVLLIKDKQAAGATFEDAEVLAKFAGLRLDPDHKNNNYNAFIDRAMGVSGEL
jgi:hypothetical protein